VWNRKFFWSRETEAETAILAKSGAISLAARIAAGPLTVAEALHYAIGIAEALRAVHSRGRVYAFLQPASVTLEHGCVHLALTGPAALSPYFSPEQVAGRDLDLRTDIFSLGTVLYEMLSGRKAFDAATKPALRIEILDVEPLPLQTVPPPVAHLVMRCLEKKPERRLQRMEILLAALKLQEILATPGEGAAAVASASA
jgi:eukaryotic-like serine/threonine-protein kinase